ncbi:MAG TPA: hypothetical protein VGZ22_09990, partial [Isosphaeraceae bacterium]|nr:hypothetical protein [Isosphaeraceae bacterium]
MRRLAASGWLWVGLSLGWLMPASEVRAQQPSSLPSIGNEDDEDKPGPGGRFKVLTGPDALEKLERLEKSAKEKLRPPIEFFRTQVAPFDVLPFVKARHWATISLELRANYADYDGRLETEPVPLQGMPHEVTYRREARLIKGQQARLSMQAMLPVIPKELSLALARPDSIRPDEAMPASLRVLETHQMLIVVMARNPSDYGHWTKFHALLPTSGDRDQISMERNRYYRLVLPQDADKPLVSTNPLTWTTISHVIWDGLDPDILNPSQQQAMLDWLHWGGQLIIIGGASPQFAQLQDSFLGPYLPADPAGENMLLGEKDLAPLAQAYRPAAWADDMEETADNQGDLLASSRYKEAVPLHPAPNRPVFFAGLRPREDVGAVVLPLGERSDRLLGVERRLGRGRILMLSFTPTDPAFTSWPGLDTLVRRVILRRPEETTYRRRAGAYPAAPGGAYVQSAQPFSIWRFPLLGGPELSWVRFVSRDLGAQVMSEPRDPKSEDSVEPEIPRAPVAEWNDAAAIPLSCRKALKEASGITIPGSSFILKVLLAYMLALVPLNWLICRYILRRREWAWAMVPVLALGFAIGVERAAAYDLGFDSGCDEIDVLEVYGDYPRGHLSRFVALFSTGRVRYTISYPTDGTAVALPMDTGDSMRGEKVAQSVWQSLPVPALVGLQVQPRSLALFRSEQMTPLPGSVDLKTEDGPRRIVNNTGMELYDAALVEEGSDRVLELGSIAPGASVELGNLDADSPPSSTKAPSKWVDPEPFLKPLRSYNWQRPEDKGELRLVAWTPKAMPGQKLEPAVDRHRIMTLVVVHLRLGPPPSPDGPRYDVLADLDQNGDKARP